MGIAICAPERHRNECFLACAHANEAPPLHAALTVALCVANIVLFADSSAREVVAMHVCMRRTCGSLIMFDRTRTAVRSKRKVVGSAGNLRACLPCVHASVRVANAAEKKPNRLRARAHAQHHFAQFRFFIVHFGGFANNVLQSPMHRASSFLVFISAVAQTNSQWPSSSFFFVNAPVAASPSTVVNETNLPIGSCL